MTAERRMLIDGTLVDADGGGTFPKINPATQQVLGVVADASTVEMRRSAPGGDLRTGPRRHRLRRPRRRRPHRERQPLRAMSVAARIRTGTLSVNGGSY